MRSAPFLLPSSTLRALLPALFLSTAAPAGAQTDESSTTAADKGVAAATPANDVEITEKARTHFRAGVNLLQDPDGARYEEAYAQFQAAYAESPSWKVLSNLGLTAMKLERDGEAIDAFTKYLSAGGDEIAQEERLQLQRDLDTLKASVVTVTITGAPLGLKLIDMRASNQGGGVSNHYTMTGSSISLGIRPGQHKITARLAGYDDAVWEVSALASSSHEHHFSLQIPKETSTGTTTGPTDSGASSRPVPTSVWIGAGVTGAFAVGATVTGIMALGKNGDYEDANEEGDPKAEDIRDSVKTLNLVADVLIGGAVVSGVVTSVLYFTRPTVPVQSAFKLEPLVGPSLAALSLSGEF